VLVVVVVEIERDFLSDMESVVVQLVEIVYELV
jgi:hypothetical protein